MCTRFRLKLSLRPATFAPREIVGVVAGYVRAAHEAGFREVR